MTEEHKKKSFKRLVFFIIGAAILILGIALVLEWWSYLGIVFKGVIGIFLALIGLFILVVAKD